MSKFEKRMNILLKLLGVVFIIEFFGILFGFYTPSLLPVASIYAFMGIFLMFSKYSSINNKGE